MRLRVAVAVVVLAIACPASAGPLLYSFTGTISGITKAYFPQPDLALVPDYDASFFPELGPGTHSITGRISYDPTPLLDADPNTGLAQDTVVINFGPYRFTAGGSLGAGWTDSPLGDRLSFADTFPSVFPPPPNGFVGLDAVTSLFDPSGAGVTGSGPPLTLDTFTHGTVGWSGLGVAFPNGLPSVAAHLSFQATIDSIHRVPEPATLSLLALGALAFIRRRH